MKKGTNNQPEKSVEEKTKCTSCKRNVNYETSYECESCGGLHHPMCSGEESDGTGEYPAEDAYSVCKKCIKYHQQKTERSVEEIVGEFAKQFDELSMKPPKNSMPGLERELLKDYLRKTIQAERQKREEVVEAERERILKEYEVMSGEQPSRSYDDIIRTILTNKTE